ncbi:MAG: cache domain-containing protein, partial [Anaerolineae bacterium]|nr:cache domain-containing protein [Anaerolineae bacterium]
MTTNSSPNRPTITATRLSSAFGASPLQQRVLWRIRLIILVLFIGITFFIVLSRQNISIDFFRRFTAGSLTALEENILEDLSDPINSITRLANSSTNRLYAQGLTRLTTTAQFNNTMNELQTDLLRQLDDIVSLRRNFYNGARYIMRDGRVWGEVINLPNETRISAETSRTIPADDPLLAALLFRAQAGVPFLSFERVSDTNVLKINIPVTAFGNTANILGFTQLEIRLDVLDSAIAEFIDSPLGAQDGRVVVLVDEQNQLIASSDNFSFDAEALNAYLDRNDGELLLSGYGDSGYVISAATLDEYDGVNAEWRVIIFD